MQKTAAILRDKKKKAVADAKEQLENLKHDSNKSAYLKGLRGLYA